MISVVLATYNEEKNIARCLDSVKDFADEIVVVDGSSTDSTRDIAKKYKAKVIKTTNKPNFHINKQMAMDEAKGELVLQLDADEVVDGELKKFILKQNEKLESRIKNQEKTHTAHRTPHIEPKAWWVRRKNLFLGSWLKKGGQYPDPVIRLYVNGYAKLPQKDVHEQMIVEGEVAWAEGHLLHYANPTFDDYLRKFNTYTSFKASQLQTRLPARQGDKVKLSFLNAINYIFYKPLITFLSLFVRHRGYVDGVPGFVFAVFSGLHHAIAYLKYWELKLKS